MYNHCNICNIPICFCNIYMKKTWNIPTKHLKHLKHTPATREVWGRAIPAVGVGAGATRAPPPPLLAATGLARPGGWPTRQRGASSARWASATGGSERCEMGARQQQGGVACDVWTGRPRLEKAAALEKASSGRMVWWMRPWWSHVCNSGERKYIYVFLFFLKKTTL
jgi:hypothetical protein